MSSLISTNTFAWNLFGPRDYAECTSENLKDTSSRLAVHFIDSVCKNKFNEGNKDDKQNECVLKMRCDRCYRTMSKP